MRSMRWSMGLDVRSARHRLGVVHALAQLRRCGDKETENKPKLYTASELAKIAILMTDGEFNFATCNGVPSQSWGSGTRINCDPSQSPFDRAEAICAAMKQEGITIYTVGLGIDTTQYSDDFLLKCASSSAHAFLADDTDQLRPPSRRSRSRSRNSGSQGKTVHDLTKLTLPRDQTRAGLETVRPLFD